MLFNSIEFLVFFALVFILYWYVFQRNLKAQNIFLLAVSYLFYGWWDWRFLGLIIFSSLIDYICGLRIANGTNKKLYLGLSVTVNIALLGVFKYYNFFIGSAADLLESLGLQANPASLQLILPVGISFYTFQTMSYTIDVYRGKIKPTKDPISFFGFVSFFPQLVAGPIERAINLLPQFFNKRSLSYPLMISSLRLVLWGLFKKIVIADNAAPIVDRIFTNYESADTLLLLLGIFFFAMQLYGDFSGYTDIARGTAGLLGFHLCRNFKAPYFSRDVAEFWRNWHISLYTWFRDYIYIPLGGKGNNKWIYFRNIAIVFLLGALWHGANWSFIGFGVINLLYFIPIVMVGGISYSKNPLGQHSRIASFKDAGQILLTFWLIGISWVYFRSPSLGDANGYLSGLITQWGFDWNQINGKRLITLLIMLVFLTIEWFGRHYENSLDTLLINTKGYQRWAIYYSVILAITFMGGRQEEFYYFQF